MDGLDDLPALRVFERVVSLGSLTAAAAALGLSLAATSKRLTNLEKRSGLQLVHRSTRRLSVTPEGQTLYQYAKRILTELQQAQEALLEQQQLISGSLRITAPNSFGHRHLLPLMGEFSQSYPHIMLQLVLSDDVKDMLAERLDIAVRYGTLPDSRLVARRLLSNSRILCASPEYVRQFGVPETLAELVQHRCIVIGTHRDTEWRFNAGSVHVSGHILCNDGEACHALALRGLGIVMKSYWDVADDLRTGHLLQLLPQLAVADAPISLVYPRSQDLAPRVKVFMDFIQEAMARLESRVKSPAVSTI
ncbi:LysR family transcriptional regulator [Shewanella yunxiaonensis]|uniref:LysR family transcriptional regulator n=1 Tax=Shewanella yunxiaonensis TaxID=2829809 RepID=A0ABX7YXS2_9GAMM|nr:MULTISPECIES: LysR family transcriptional regulator [Shewanella]MDF0534881.1 LysR substrate-binding domain-containing protein [Shewanella sp. A32]QUN07268.1 LysR family transcriptional regulator [Shewanella yunxiaonensis]